MKLLPLALLCAACDWLPACSSGISDATLLAAGNALQAAQVAEHHACIQGAATPTAAGDCIAGVDSRYAANWLRYEAARNAVAAGKDAKAAFCGIAPELHWTGCP